MNEPKTSLLYIYICSNGSGMADEKLLKFEGESWTLWDGCMGHTVLSKETAEEELCSKYQSVLLDRKSVCVKTNLNELIQG